MIHPSTPHDGVDAADRASVAPHASGASEAPRIVITGGKEGGLTGRIVGFDDETGEPVEICHDGHKAFAVRHLCADATAAEIAHIDWLGLTLPIPEGVENIPSWAVSQLARFGFSTLSDRGKGWFGYKHQHAIDDDCGLVAFGGEAQKNTLHIELTGKGCSVVPNWAELRTWCEKTGAKITRVDLAHDDHAGQTADIETCKRWLADGLFSMGRRPPKSRLVDDLGTGGGCTLYVGNRGNGKLFRGYEKGKQLGDAASAWFRLEVELRAKDRVIPLDVLTNPAPYLAGAFPAMAFLSEIQNKIKTVKKAAEVSIDRAIENARNTVGKLVNVLACSLGWEPMQIVRTLQRDGVPSRLKPFDRFLAAEGVT